MSDKLEEIQGTTPAEGAELPTEPTGTEEATPLPEVEAKTDEQLEAERVETEKKPWYQKRFNELTRQREEERRRAERLETMLHEVYTKQQAPPVQPQAEQPPKQEDFADYDEFLRAAARHEVRQELRAERAKEEEHRRRYEAQSYEEQQRSRIVGTIEKAKASHADFDLVVTPSLPVSHVMLGALSESDHGPDILYYLGKNPQESARIAGLTPYGQVRELGKIEAKISQPKATTNAPAPIKPVSSRGPVATDWINDENLPAAEWIKRRNKQLYG
jgi:Asp-tRNA(Asn)/Glu-tRNA(Gln) amidotransferase A subunit family amidase